ncbi:hypothetical protein K6H11_003852 [Candida tropicalis]
MDNSTELPPPTYTENLFDKSNPKIRALISPCQYVQPQYVISYGIPGWTVVMKKRRAHDGFRVFVSEDAFVKFNKFKGNTSDEVTYMQQQGFAIPLFKVIAPLHNHADPVLTFKKFTPTNNHPFDADKDFYNYCTVSQIRYSAYTTHILKFKPDPNDARTKFRVYVFSHTILPISDYIYKGVKHRWVEETLSESFNQQQGLRYGFRHTVLQPHQVSLTDNWDGKSNILDSVKRNPYIQGHLSRRFSLSSRYPISEYYGWTTSEVLCGTLERYYPSFSGVRIVDSRGLDKSIEYESILSLQEDDLVIICIASVLKWDKDFRAIIKSLKYGEIKR